MDLALTSDPVHDRNRISCRTSHRFQIFRCRVVVLPFPPFSSSRLRKVVLWVSRGLRMRIEITFPEVDQQKKGVGSFTLAQIFRSRVVVLPFLPFNLPG
jgi:hypothetical protein